MPQDCLKAFSNYALANCEAITEATTEATETSTETSTCTCTGLDLQCVDVKSVGTNGLFARTDGGHMIKTSDTTGMSEELIKKLLKTD